MLGVKGMSKTTAEGEVSVADDVDEVRGAGQQPLR